MLKIGLTGGIACGKTTVAKQFAKLGAPVIDADAITRELMQKTTPVFQEIITHFGDKILDKSGEINRSKLADIIFNDATEKTWLEKLVHPAVRQAMQKKIETLTAPYCILMIPLLVETLPNPLIDRILVVDCNEKIQMARLQQRDNFTKEQATTIIQQQAARSTRLQLANDVIDNDSDPKNIVTRVTQLHNYYLEIANKTK